MGFFHTLPEVLTSAYLRLGAPGQGLLLAVSGGADSVALLLATANLSSHRPQRIEVATLDHGLRPESADEVSQVRGLCEKWQIPFHTRRLQLKYGPAVEARARQARYEALESIRLERSLDLIVTAHTADDQAETLLMRLSRGASTRGLAAIHEKRGHVIRPLLEVTRGEVMAFLKGHPVEPVNDVMNHDERFLRVMVRKQVVPRLEAGTGPGLTRRLARAARLFSEDDAYLTMVAREALQRARISSETLDAASVRALLPPIQRRVLALFLEEASVEVSLETIEWAQKAVWGAPKVNLGKDLLMQVKQGQLFISRAPPRRRNGRV